MRDISLEVWGDFACFSRPECKVERLSYPVITPSAARGILSAIYSKPIEFYWQVKRIEVLKPIRYISFKRNEVVNSKISDKMNIIFVDETLLTEKGKGGERDRKVGREHRVQRQSVVLKDVRYRITAEIVKRPSFTGTLEQLYVQAQNRIEKGKCFFQPSLGLREFVCYFGPPDASPPISDSCDFGYMLYDVFDFKNDIEVKEKMTPQISLFNAKMDSGVIAVPNIDSPLVLKPKGGIADA